MEKNMKLEKIHEYTMQMPHEMYDYMIFSLTIFKEIAFQQKVFFSIRLETRLANIRIL